MERAVEGRSTRGRALRWCVPLMLIGGLVVPLTSHAAVALANVTAVQGGDWDGPATWGGAVPPSADAAIVIPANVSVIIPVDLVVSQTGGTIQIDGFLFVGGEIDLDRTDLANTSSGELWLID